jgi:beta-aspartyl-peptidase (threonine type)
LNHEVERRVAGRRPTTFLVQARFSVRIFFVRLLAGLIMPVSLVSPAFAATPNAGAQTTPDEATVLVIHGGAGVLTKEEMDDAGLTSEDFERALACALRAGHHAIQQGRTCVDAVETTVRSMEDCGLFNAGRGAAFNSDGRVELDSAIMEGRTQGAGEGKGDPRKRAGAVTGVAHIKNPISAARAVMETPGSPHVLLAGEGAEWFALSEANRKRYGIVKVSNVYFWTDRRVKQIREVLNQQDEPTDGQGALLPGVTPQRRNADGRFATVGAVALDADGGLAAGTSSGGLPRKTPGRIGGSPIIGAGTYADDRACGVSCTGTGEVFIRHAVAHDVVARMLYGERTVTDAARQTIDSLPDESGGVGGLIALDRHGKHAFVMSSQSVGMYRGYVTQKGEVYVAIFADEPAKRIDAAP